MDILFYVKAQYCTFSRSLEPTREGAPTEVPGPNIMFYFEKLIDG